MVKTILIAMFILEELYALFIIHLKSVAAQRPLPEAVSDVYDSERYSLFRKYRKENMRMDFLSSLFSLVVSLIFLVTDLYAAVFNAFDGMNIYLRYFLMITVFIVITQIIEMPFSYYEIFKIEDKYDMNRMTKKTFFLDKLKASILGIVLYSLIISLMIFFFSRFGILAVFWIAACVIVMVLILNALIVPLMRIFNRFTPLEEGELRTKLTSLCTKYNVKVKRIVVRDASRRTTKANAFCSGMRKKTISIDDNLMNDFTTDEIVAVFAHEFAHAKYRHALKSLPLSFSGSIIYIAAVALILSFAQLFTAFGFNEANYFFALAVLLPSLTWPFSIPIETLTNSISRKHEYEADAFAAEEGWGEALISALKRLVKESLADINPHPWIVITSYSHPTLAERIESIRKHEPKV